MKTLRFFLLAVACAAPALGHAEWQWIDATGRRVFSDQPPPPDTPQKNILRQPGPRPASLTFEKAAPAGTAPAEAAAAAPKAAASAGRPSGRDGELEAKRKQLEAAEAQKRKAEEERVAKARADNCTRARQAKATLDSGQRLARVNDKGEREVLDDAARATELQRVQDIIASECKPA
jgi:hypothetical protein